MNGLSINREHDIGGMRREYASLQVRARKKIDTFDSFMWVIHPFFTAVTIVVVAIKTGEIGATLVAGLMYVYIPGAILSGILSAILDAIFGKRFGRYLEDRRLTSKWYRRYIHLGIEISEYEKEEKLRLENESIKEAEAKRIRLLPVRNAMQPLHDQLTKETELIRPLEDYFRRKQKWFSEYRKDENAIEQCLERLKGLDPQCVLIRARFADVAEEVSYEFHRLFRDISSLTQRCELLLIKMRSMRYWTAPVRTTPQVTTPRNNANPRSNGAPRTTPPQTERIVPVPRSRPTIAMFEDSTEDYDYSVPVQPPIVVVPPPPPQRRVLNRRLTNLPLQDYVGAAMAQMEIGKLGEIIVLHYELRRVEEETGSSAQDKVSRVSLESNSLGYDVESFSQGETVFIEVKSTTGPFWKDFFISANELKVMREKGENYWLYRIFELSRENGNAKLSVFRGKSEIDASFELEPTNYRMNPISTADGTLPFETLE